jgi:hypothetical protein
VSCWSRAPRAARAANHVSRTAPRLPQRAEVAAGMTPSGRRRPRRRFGIPHTASWRRCRANRCGARVCSVSPSSSPAPRPVGSEEGRPRDDERRCSVVWMRKRGSLSFVAHGWLQAIFPSGDGTHVAAHSGPAGLRVGALTSPAAARTARRARWAHRTRCCARSSSGRSTIGYTRSGRRRSFCGAARTSSCHASTRSGSRPPSRTPSSP